METFVNIVRINTIGIKMDKLILLKRIRPVEYEIHRNSIDRSNNLILTTKDEEFAKRLVDAYNSYNIDINNK